MEQGCFTALATPFNPSGELDQSGVEKLIEFQIENGITGILATGTTGESPSFNWKEHDLVVALSARAARGKCLCIAGTGSNNTREALAGTEHAVKEGVDGLLLVDPYYNGPSSLEIRKEYYEVVAKAFPDTSIVPYIIPGRTGAQLLPQDLALLAEACPNVQSVKEATGDLANMKLTRKLCKDGFKILSGDDGLVYEVMTDPDIKACGAISVMSNLVPGFMTRMVALLNEGKNQEAKVLRDKLSPLLDLVVVTTEEQSPMGPVKCRARNPLPLKTMMQILGMPSGPCRKPLGRMTEKGLNIVLDALKKVAQDSPEFFEPIGKFFSVDIEDRLNNPEYQKDLWYNY